MRKLLQSLCFITFFYYVYIPLHAENITIKIATGEWAPYVSSKMKNFGPSTEIIQASCKAANILPIIEFYPWKRTEHYLSQGEYFGAYPYTIRKDRQKIFDFSEPLFKTVVVYVYYKQNIESRQIKNIKTLADLKNYRLGGLSGSFQFQELDGKVYKIHCTTNIQQAIKMLVKNRIHFFLEERTVAFYEIEKAFPGKSIDFGILNFHYGSQTYDALMVSRKYPNSDILLKKFNEGLKSIKQNNIYTAIVNKYNMAPAD